jgi:hypothetical protein
MCVRTNSVFECHTQCPLRERSYSDGRTCLGCAPICPVAASIRSDVSRPMRRLLCHLRTDWPVRISSTTPMPRSAAHICSIAQQVCPPVSWHSRIDAAKRGARERERARRPCVQSPRILLPACLHCRGEQPAGGDPTHRGQSSPLSLLLSSRVWWLAGDGWLRRLPRCPSPVVPPLLLRSLAHRPNNSSWVSPRA